MRKKDYLRQQVFKWAFLFIEECPVDWEKCNFKCKYYDNCSQLSVCYKKVEKIFKGGKKHEKSKKRRKD